MGVDGGLKLLDLGNPAAQKWLTDHVDKTITEQGIDLYRQDFNFDPLGYWRGNDAPDRQGITENLHVQGYLAYWDELRRRHPKLLLDSCASGGRRNDLETLRRSVPLHKTDYKYSDQPAKQAFHRNRCRQASVRLKLRGLDADARYVLTDLDRPGKTEAAGRELMTKGLLVTTDKAPAACILTYKRLPPARR